MIEPNFFVIKQMEGGHGMDKGGVHSMCMHWENIE